MDAGYFSGDNAAENGAGLDLLIAAGRDDPAEAPPEAGQIVVRTLPAELKRSPERRGIAVLIRVDRIVGSVDQRRDD